MHSFDSENAPSRTGGAATQAQQLLNSTLAQPLDPSRQEDDTWSVPHEDHRTSEPRAGSLRERFMEINDYSRALVMRLTGRDVRALKLGCLSVGAGVGRVLVLLPCHHMVTN